MGDELGPAVVERGFEPAGEVPTIMSYLHPPRLHFGGLFYTSPATINNCEESYNSRVRLEDEQHRYLGDGGDDGPAGWNPTGTAQLWLEECRVLSAVGPSGLELASPEEDELIGASIESPSPLTPKSDPGGEAYDIAKIADLDPEQQGRPAVYGLRIFVCLKGGGGFPDSSRPQSAVSSVDAFRSGRGAGPESGPGWDTCARSSGGTVRGHRF